MKVLDPLDLGSNQIHHVADGSANDDAATYGQVKNLVNGLDFKEAVVVAVSSNVTVASPGGTLNGVTPSTLDRVLLTAQTSAPENGVWLWNGAAVPMTRPADFVTGEVTQGATVAALGGTSPTRAQWSLLTAGAITVGTTALSFSITGAPGATYVNGYGLTLTTGTFAVDTTKIPSKFAIDVGDGSSTAIDITHNLGTLDVEVTVRDKTSGLEVLVDNGPKTGSDVNKVTLTFAVAPTSAQYRCVVIG